MARVPALSAGDIATYKVAIEAGVTGYGTNTPPGAPAANETYILGSSPTGAWAGNANKIASYISAAWVFLPAASAIGSSHRNIRLGGAASDTYYVWDGSAWNSFAAPTRLVDHQNTIDPMPQYLMRYESTGGGGTLTDGNKGDITVSSSGAVWTINNDIVTYAKMQNISATDRLLGRDTAGAGDTEELSVSGGIEFTGSGGIQTSAFTGDATKTAGGTALTLATVNSNTGSWGTATAVGQFTVNGKGLITAAANVTVTPAYASLTAIPAAIDAIDGLTPAADQVAYYTGAAAAALTTLSAFGRTLIDDADAATARTTIGAAATSHTHAESEVTGLVADLAARPTLQVTMSIVSMRL